MHPRAAGDEQQSACSASLETQSTQLHAATSDETRLTIGIKGLVHTVAVPINGKGGQLLAD